MNLAGLSIKRPVFVSSLVILMLALGYLSLKRLAVDLFPSITFPVVMVSTTYPGAGPAEVETLVSKVFENEFSTLSGIKSLRSNNREGISTVVAEFTLETDIKFAEQQIRDRIGSAKRKLPADIQEPVIRRLDPNEQPILILTMTAKMPEGELYDLADDYIKPKIEQVNQVGSVSIMGGKKREIRVELDRDKLKSYEVSVNQVSNRLAAAGMNIPAGKVEEQKTETVFRTLGEFRSIKDIASTIINFMGNDVPVTIADVGRVHDTLSDEKSRSFVNGQKALFMMVYRQSGANTIAVVDAVKKRVEQLNGEMKTAKGDANIIVVRDGAKMIRANVDDVKESILIGIILTILVVYFFLGSGRSTIITGLALPNSLIGAFLFMAIAGFTVNMMSLLALSLAVGLLIDDAIVVRENIFRHNELGKSPVTAALEGTKEVTLAVVATTLTVIAVFGSIGFLQGVVGQFFKEFGLTVCFAMSISLFDALTMAPMLSAYFAYGGREAEQKGVWGKTMGRLTDGFDRFQTWMEETYGTILKFTLTHPLIIIGLSIILFAASVFSIKYIPKTFIPTMDSGEFMVSLELPPGANINAMTDVALEVDKKIRANPEVQKAVAIIGGMRGEANSSTFFVELVPSKKRKVNTTEFKASLRKQLAVFKHAKPIIKDVDMIGGGMRPFNVSLVGNDLSKLEQYANIVYEKLKKHPGLSDPDISYRPGKPEYQVILDNRKAETLGVSTTTAGQELRAQIEGLTPALFRENGREYDIRVRLKEDQRNLKYAFNKTFVPNINYTLVRLKDVAKSFNTTGPASIDRQDRGRYIQISADLAHDGPGLGAVIDDVKTMFEKDIQLPDGMRYRFVGQAESFKEMLDNMVLAAALAILFIFLVLASLYESFVTPFTIMLVLPLAASGAFIALFAANTTLDIFSMIGCIMLLGIATKNSILLVDYTKQLVEKGVEQKAAIIQAGKTRLRPILMTTGALIAGMLPIAIGLNEASQMRTSMGIAVIGGLVSSTVLTLVVVPAAYSYVEKFRKISSDLARRIFSPKGKFRKTDNHESVTIDRGANA